MADDLVYLRGYVLYLRIDRVSVVGRAVMSDVRTHDIVRQEIKADYATTKRNGRFSWRRLAAHKKYNPIPAGTLCAIANGADVPARWMDHTAIRLPHPIGKATGKAARHESGGKHGSKAERLERFIMSRVAHVRALGGSPIWANQRTGKSNWSGRLPRFS